MLFGMALLLPLAPVPVYGVITDITAGHMSLCYLLAIIPMSFSAISFGRMGAEFPRAGSSYTFTSKAISHHLGFIVGWTILLDYGLFPLVNYVTLAIFSCQLFPGLSYKAVIICAILFVCVINLLGIKKLATVNNILTIFGFLVVFYFIYSATNALAAGVGTGFSSVAFIDPATFDWSKILTGTAIACFSFLGFDAITTLAEEVDEPRKTIPRATLLTCIIMGVLFAVMAYLAKGVFPDITAFTNPDAAFIDAAIAAGGQTLSKAISLAMVACAIAYSTDMMAGVTRLLYGMGRDGVLPKKIFGYAHPKTNVPVYNVLLITAFCLIFSGLKLGDLIPIINFGGLLAFICVNFSVVSHFYIRKGERNGVKNKLWNLIIPSIGGLVCLGLWLSLPTGAKLIGGSWALAGIIYMAVFTKGFKKPMPEMH